MEIERQKKLALEAAVANRKRSSRVEAKMIRQKEEEERAEAERKTQEELRLAQRTAQREAAERQKIARVCHPFLPISYPPTIYQNSCRSQTTNSP